MPETEVDLLELMRADRLVLNKSQAEQGVVDREAAGRSARQVIHRLRLVKLMMRNLSVPEAFSIAVGWSERSKLK